MGYRSGTYVAFDGNDTTDPTESDMKYYGLLQGWNKNKEYNFLFTDSHKKTNAVKDSSCINTLKSRLLERMSFSKNMLIIISKDTNYDRGLLNWEIEKAIDYYKIPLIVVYVGYSYILKPYLLENKWPKALKERINNGNAKCIHIPFKMDPIKDALNKVSIHNNFLTASLTYYTEESYKNWGLK